MRREIRVLHCIHSLSGGGAERQLRMLARLSSSVNIRASILCVKDTGNDLDDEGIKIYKSAKSNKYNLSIFSSLTHAITDFRPDIIHAWLPAAVTIPTLLCAGIRKIPCVYSYRTVMRFYRVLSIPEYLLALCFAKKIVSNNPVSQSTYPFRWMFGLKNGVKINNAVHVESKFYKTDLAVEPKELYRILFVGRITGAKNLGCLLRSLPLVDAGFEWELTICGDGEDRTEFIKLAKELAVFDRIRMLGFREDVYSIMQSTDIMVHPSWYEGMPNVLLEAMTIGVPSVVSDIAAHREIVGESSCVLKFDHESPGSLAGCLNQFMSSPGIMQEMVTEARIIADRYSPEIMVELYRGLYTNMIEI